MNIIEEMRREAHLAPTSGLEYLEQCITRWADALEQSGALVPVKVGEECEARDCRSPFIHCGKLFTKYCDEVVTGKRPYIDSDAPVQPVCLVPLAEWVPEGGA